MCGLQAVVLQDAQDALGLQDLPRGSMRSTILELGTQKTILNRDFGYLIP